MKDNDRIINNNEYDVSYLDQQLLKTLDYLKINWFDPHSGFVASILIDKEKSVIATNTFVTGDRLRHAEFNAVTLYEKKYGPVSSKALLVVTLSPCIVYSGYREGPSCSQFLLDKEITRVHVGLNHEKQGGLDAYSSMGINLSVTKDQRINRVSKSLLELYVANKNLVANDLDHWLRAKEKVGLEIFQ